MNNIEITKNYCHLFKTAQVCFTQSKSIRTYLDKDGFTYLPEGKCMDS